VPPSGRTPLPGPHPPPPADLAHRQLPLTHLQQHWFRIYRLQYAPLFFDPAPRSRFNAPAGEYGTLYAGLDPHCAFIETFGQATGINAVTEVALRERGLCRVECNRALALVDLTGAGLARLGADGRLCSGDHHVARQWSLALWRHPDAPDGLLFRARHDPSRAAVAIFDRAQGSLHTMELGSLLEPSHAMLLADMLTTYGFGILPSP
jgi:hypothetical protein